MLHAQATSGAGGRGGVRAADRLLHRGHLAAREAPGAPRWFGGRDKLGQKIPDPDAPGDVRHRQTTIYLAPGEATALATLDGPRTVKRRYKLEEQGWT